MKNEVKINQIEPEVFLFEADGFVPNSKLPALVYRGVLDFTEVNQSDAEACVSEIVSQHGWYLDWKYHVYPFLHYHSTAHEALIIYSGVATLQLGGKNGKMVNVTPGDVIIIPAGVGHERILQLPVDKREEEIQSLLVFGAYPNGQKWDFLSEDPGAVEDGGQNIYDVNVKESAIANIQKLSTPLESPVFGNHGLEKWWNKLDNT